MKLHCNTVQYCSNIIKVKYDSLDKMPLILIFYSPFFKQSKNYLAKFIFIFNTSIHLILKCV